MTFIDTNYFLRYLLDDLPDQSNEVKMLFLVASERKAELLTSNIVIFEVFWVLSSFYKFNKIDVARSLKGLLKLSFIQLYDREILQDAISLFEKTNLDLEDCYNLYFAKSKGIKKSNFKTFDKRLEKEFNK